ncbi:2-oxoacid:acceptor oxidoreductase subunit alpha [Chloroflexota bacterium]
MRYQLTIGIAGAGGDGVVALGSFLQKLTAEQGYFSQMARYYGAQIRGGGSAAKLGLNAQHSSLSKDTLDMLVCFNWEKYWEVRHELDLAEETIILSENPIPSGFDVPGNVIQVAFGERSQEATGSARNKNIVAFGFLVQMLGLPDSQVRKIIEHDVELTLLKNNLAAVEAGTQLFAEYSLPEIDLAQAKGDSSMIILHGNAAIARGAIRAGCHAFFGYPITPASEVMQEMDNAFFNTGDVFLQAEDEIASASMVVGASLTGTKAITATSGPGLDLMTEVMGLAITSETPMVIVDIQRGGPSTGIPSKSEQSDLNHAIYGGHGDAPRVVMAPYDVEGCYRLAIESINIAQYYQTVVIFLSDQWLGQTLVATDDRFIKLDYPIVERKCAEVQEAMDYRRYQETEDGISPMSAAGDEGLTYQTSGLTRNEKGAPSFAFETHQYLHEKRWGKLLPLTEREDLVKVFGNLNHSKGIISWGSSAQVVLETVKELAIEDDVKVCVPELIYPLPAKVREFIESVDTLLVIEMNYSGQFYRYIRSQIDLPKDTRLFNRAGGRIFGVRELTDPIAEVAK